ncbi:hypothetical protein AGMMS50239_07120 [Bacteroidia bacterium]|nr:hypothetical protein AGMMS50239_07120 [Bacteroidia bacterium]
MNKFFLLILFCFFSTFISSQTWYREEINDLCGYVDSLGVVKIPFEYMDAFTYEFTDSIAFVAIIENGVGKIKTIDRNNKKLFTVYSSDDIGEALFRIQDDSTGYVGFADLNGSVIIPPRFFYVNLFNEGFAAFNTGGHLEPMDEEHTLIVGGKWGYINKEGKEVFPAIFDKARSFDGGKAEVQIGKQVFCISSNKCFER